MDYTLVVIGADTSIGLEVARLGIAYGCFVYGVTDDGAPELDEPWVQGVNWIDVDEWLDDGPHGAVVVVEMDDLEPVLAQAEKIARLVVVDLDGSIDPDEFPDDVVIAMPDDVDDTPDQTAQIAEAGPIRVEQLAMALLRAALDDDVDGKLDHEALLHLGASVMMQ